MDTDRRSVHLVRRGAEGSWSFHGWTADGTIELTSLGAALAMDALYDRVTAEPTPGARPA